VIQTLAGKCVPTGRFTAQLKLGHHPVPGGDCFFENAGRAWPDRGANQRGLAEVRLRQGRELPEALELARQALKLIVARRAWKKKRSIPG